VRELVEAAVQNSTPGWRIRDDAAQAFSLENGAEQLLVGFTDLQCVRPAVAGRVTVKIPDRPRDDVGGLHNGLLKVRRC
jgi:hypothetical protein